jgi:DNA polymerase V
MYALLDCNNFYASCERIFDPSLINRPLIVLSNNDGCAIARSNEAKALGIKIGVPVHQIQGLIKAKNIAVRSANFSLYGDLSNRVMSIILQHHTAVEVYSIDEAFIGCDDVKSPISFMCELKNTVEQWTGIPVCIGIGKTKTLAKIANHIAKKTGTGVFCLDEANTKDILEKFSTGEIWGIGRRTNKRLRAMKINTARDLQQAPASWVREQFNVVMTRTQNELNGISCIALDEIEPDRKQIICSRSFGSTLSEYGELAQAVANFVHRAAEKMRKRNLQAILLTVAINTNPYSKIDKQYHQSGTIKLAQATASTKQLSHFALGILKNIYKPHYPYKRAGVILSELSSKGQHQRDLFDNFQDDSLALVMDKINQRFGRDIIVPGRLMGSFQQWKMRQTNLSKAYTTDWAQLMEVC